MESRKSEATHIAETRDALLKAALPHVVFDGWSQATLDAAIADSGVNTDLATLAVPRGAVDLALAFHHAGDAQLAADMATKDMSDMRYSEKVAYGIRQRLTIAEPHREAVRRGSALFALPNHAADGAKAIWHTADTIWNALGDTSEDVNWYTKRMTLSAVYSACVLFWLGDESVDTVDTADFIDRRIENVMQFEKAKSQFRESSLGKAFLNGPAQFLSKIKSPGEAPSDLPGHFKN